MEEREMEKQLRALSLNYLDAPIEIREKFTFDEAETKALLLHLRENWGVNEAILISTCNRTELYFKHSASPSKLLKVLSAYRGLNSEVVAPFFQIFNNSSEAITHLFRVGIGLESQILGDFQIINQVKNAYQWCADVNMAGPYLHRLLHSLFFANKRVAQETNFRSGSASVAYATKELIEDLIADKSQPISLIGLGEIGLPVLKNLLENGFSNLTVCNRTEEKVQSFVDSDGVRFVPFANWKTCLNSTVVISAVSGNVLSISSNDVENQNKLGFQYLIDLGLPRSIHSEAGNHDGIVLFNLDQIQSKVSEAHQIRKNSVPHVESIVQNAQTEFEDWTKEMQVSPVIQLMKNSLEQIRQEEMSRFLKKASKEQADWADELTKNLMQRIMKTHVVALKAACKRDEADQLVEVLNQLFNVAGEEVKA